MIDYIHKIDHYGVIGDLKSSSLSNFLLMQKYYQEHLQHFLVSKTYVCYSSFICLQNLTIYRALF